jgi:hypothetical protein
MSIKAKLKAAVSKAKKMKGGPGDDNVQEVSEANASSKNTFTGPFARLKARQTIKKGKSDSAYAIKNNPLTNKRKVITYKDAGRTNTPQKTKIASSRKTNAYFIDGINTELERSQMQRNRLEKK